MEVNKRSMLYKIWKLGRSNIPEHTNICAYFWCVVLKITVAIMPIYFYSLWWYFSAPEAKTGSLVFAILTTGIFLFFASMLLVEKFWGWGKNSFMGNFIKATKEKHCVFITFK